MDPRTWPLSVAATRLLLDLRHRRPAPTTDGTVFKLAIKELVMRGGLAVDEVVVKRRTTQMIVSARTPGAALPETVAVAARHLRDPQRVELRTLVKQTLKRKPTLPRTIRTTAEAELAGRGLTMLAERRILGLFKQRYLAPSPSGDAWQRAAEQIVERAERLADVAGRRAVDPAAIDALGPLVLLAPGGLALAARGAARRRAANRHRADAPANGWDDRDGGLVLSDARSVVERKSRRDTVDSSATASGACETDPAVSLVPAGAGLGATPSNDDSAGATGGITHDGDGHSGATTHEGNGHTGATTHDGNGHPGATTHDGNGHTGATGPHDGDDHLDPVPFSPLDGLDDALGGFFDDVLSGLDSIGDALDAAMDSVGASIDGAIDSVDSAIDSIDSAIDSGVSAGGGDGGSGGGGGDGGGGGS